MQIYREYWLCKINFQLCSKIKTTNLNGLGCWPKTKAVVYVFLLVIRILLGGALIIILLVLHRATTHTDLVVRAKKMGIDVKIVHNASVINAIGICGLQLYRYGETVSIPFFTETWRPDSFYEKIHKNKEIGLHTLCLLGWCAIFRWLYGILMHVISYLLTVKIAVAAENHFNIIIQTNVCKLISKSLPLETICFL